MPDDLLVRLCAAVPPPSSLAQRWVARREAAEELSADAAATPFVQLSEETVTPNAENASVYAERLRELENRTLYWGFWSR